MLLVPKRRPNKCGGVQMSAFKSLSSIKDNLPEKAKPIKRIIKSNINESIFVSDHAVERFLQRELNNTITNVKDFKKYVADKVASSGVIGFYDPKLNQEYVAVERCGLFIKKGMVLTTFIAPENMNAPLTEIYIKLLQKGRVDV